MLTQERTGTDAELLPELTPKVIRQKKRGRPQANKDLILKLLKTSSNGKPTYSNKQIMSIAKIGKTTLFKIQKELIAEGKLEVTEERREASIIEGDFDQECTRATGQSFLEWMKQRQPQKHRYIFNFCEKVWINVWDMPSLVNVHDVDSQDAAICAKKFLDYFGDDEKRMRNRLKNIRQLFRFLGRMDICDRDLVMTESRQPRNIRQLPIIEFKNFPIKFEEVLSLLPEDDQFLIKFKCVSQCRTGDAKRERGLLGIKKNSGKSYIIMQGVNDYRIHIFEKMGEQWDITQVPLEVREKLWERYQKLNDGEYFFYLNGVNKRFYDATLKVLGQKLILHDCRKISITWYYVLGIPLEIATMLNVGWKDLNTPRQHYLQMRKLLRRNDKQEYRANIKPWFREGTEEFLEEGSGVDKIPSGGH